MIIHKTIKIGDKPTKDDIKETVSYVVDSGVNGIKLQLLHILEATDLAEEFRQGHIDVLELEEYVDLVKECVALIPPQVVIHRITGDGDKKLLIAPLWSADKKTVLNTIRSAFINDDLVQGELAGKADV